MSRPSVGVPVTVVVPMLNAAERIEPMHRVVRTYLDEAYPGSEILLVDDGSSDTTWSRIERLATEDPLTSGVRLESNVGQVGAMCAGFSRARSEVVVTMDDDLDCHPTEIGKFVEAVRAGASFASGWRHGSRAPIRALGSRWYNTRIRQLGFPLHDAGCGLNALSNDLARQVAALGWGVRLHRIKLVVALMTDELVEISFPVQPTSESHYGLRRLATAWLDTELTFGRLTPAGAAVIGLVAPGAIAGAGLARALSSQRSCSSRALSAVAAVLCGATAAGALSVLHLWWTIENRSRTEPAFRIRSTAGALTGAQQ